MSNHRGRNKRLLFCMYLIAFIGEQIIKILNYIVVKRVISVSLRIWMRARAFVCDLVCYTFVGRRIDSLSDTVSYHSVFPVPFVSVTNHFRKHTAANPAELIVCVTQHNRMYPYGRKLFDNRLI